MASRARISITTGPDRGKLFELRDELVHIGKGTDNQVVLSDPSLADHQASIVSRNGRYAIYTSVAEGIEVEGNPIPPERWVWLPTEANIRISRRTICQFVSTEGDDRPAEPETDRNRRVAEPPPLPGEDKPRRSEAKNKKTIARFITDGVGDPLVKLGADGHLPELRLDAGRASEQRDNTPRQTSPLLLVAAIGGSFLLSILMLVLETETNSEQLDKTQARLQIEKYYGEPDETPEPYQLALRRARLATSRRDRESERFEYQRVLKLLRAEGHERKVAGLTGNRRGRSDKELETLIGVLLGN